MLPGVFRLRLPLPWPGVPHCNAWAVASGDGFVLFDTGMHQPDSLAHLERALAMCNLRLEDSRLVVCTHAHSDHYGQAASVVQRAGCELWMGGSYIANLTTREPTLDVVRGRAKRAVVDPQPRLRRHRRPPAGPVGPASCNSTSSASL